MAAEPKTQKTKASVSAFLNAVENDKRRADAKAVAKLMEDVTKEKPAMWGPSIIGYGSHRLTYANGKGADWPIAAFSPRKTSLVVYLWPEFEGKSELLAKLGKHKTGKSCLYISSMDDIHVPTLKALIKQSMPASRAKE